MNAARAKSAGTSTPAYKRRILVLSFMLLAGFFIVAIRLVDLQILRAEHFKDQAENQHMATRKILPKRGEIKIKDSIANQPYTVATSIDKPFVFADPKIVNDADRLATEVSKIFGLNPEDIKSLVGDKSKRYVVIKKDISAEQKKQIVDLQIEGLAIGNNTERFYPDKNFMSQTLGFVGYGAEGDEKTGLYGLEKAFNNDLVGIPGSVSLEKDGTGAWIFGAKRDEKPAQDGANFQLTIDKTIQFKAENIVKKAVENNLADSGSIAIMNPKSGALMAMANYPSFDPNDYSKTTDASIYNNLATQGNYEPGSIFKPLTIAIAVNEGKISASSTYTDTGVVKIDGYEIKNSDEKAHGLQTMSQVLEESLNTGVIYAKNLVGNKKFLDYLQKFGFGEKTGIEVAEGKGDLSNLSGNIAVNYHTASFGQGISVTPMQMLKAFSALANGGKMVTPYLVESKTASSGELITSEKSQPQQIITAKTASEITGMLVNVVEKGHGKKAAVPGYYIAGKTGTAQVPKENGRGYQENNNIGSFIGYGPVEDPQFVMIVRINHPRTVKYAESTAAPAFGQMAQFLMTHLNIKPTRK